MEENEVLGDESLVDDSQLEAEFEDAFENELVFGEQSSTAVEDEPPIEDRIQAVIEKNPSLSEAQVRELFEHNNQRLYGKFGEVQREIKRLEALAQQSLEYRQQPSKPINITAENFANMREEFGEDFANALARDLANLPLGSQSQGIDPAQIDMMLSKRTESIKNDFEVRIVEMQHPDWREIANLDDFKGWKSQLPIEIQNKADTTWDSNFISKMLSAYKSDANAHRQSLQKAEQDRVKAENAKQRKLQSAVMPQSRGHASDDYDDDFEAGFNS